MNKIKIELKWAVIFVLFTLLWMVFEKAMGWHDEFIADHATYTLLFSLPAVVLYVLALRDKKINYYQGKMSWGQGMICGLIISAFVALISPLSQYITHTFITPDYFENAIHYSVESGQSTQSEADEYFNLKSYIFQSAIGAFVMGVVTSAIVSLFLKSKSEKR